MYAQYQRLNLHVTATNRELVKSAHKLLSPKGKSNAQRQARHDWLRQMLNYHKDEQQLCKDFRF